MAMPRKPAVPKPAVPKPVVVTTICSECGLGWALHGADPTTDDCIRLLKAELAGRPIHYYYNYSYPHMRPLVQPALPPSPWWSITTGGSSETHQLSSGGLSSESSSTSNSGMSVNTPRVLSTACKAIS